MSNHSFQKNWEKKKRKKYNSDNIDSSYISEKNAQPLKKNLFFYFLCTFGKSNLKHLTTNVIFSGQRFAILTMFFSGQVAWFLFCSEVAGFCVWRRCVFFVCGEVEWFFLLTHSGCMIYFSGGCMICFAERLHDFFVERLCEEVVCFCVWRGCVIFCVKRLFSEKKSFLMNFFFCDFFCYCVFGTLWGTFCKPFLYGLKFLKVFWFLSSSNIFLG